MGRSNSDAVLKLYYYKVRTRASALPDGRCKSHLQESLGAWGRNPDKTFVTPLCDFWVVSSSQKRNVIFGSCPPAKNAKVPMAVTKVFIKMGRSNFDAVLQLLTRNSARFIGKNGAE